MIQETTVVLPAPDKKETLHEILKPKIQNLIKYTAEALEKEGAPDAVKVGYAAEFGILLADANRFELFVELLMQHWKTGSGGIGYLDHQELDAFQEETKKAAESSLAEWMPGMSKDDLEHARQCLRYQLNPEHKTMIRRYFSCFCAVKSLEVQSNKSCCK